MGQCTSTKNKGETQDDDQKPKKNSEPNVGYIVQDTKKPSADEQSKKAADSPKPTSVGYIVEDKDDKKTKSNKSEAPKASSVGYIVLDEKKTGDKITSKADDNNVTNEAVFAEEKPVHVQDVNEVIVEDKVIPTQASTQDMSRPRDKSPNIRTFSIPSSGGEDEANLVTQPPTTIATTQDGNGIPEDQASNDTQQAFDESSCFSMEDIKVPLFTAPADLPPEFTFGEPEDIKDSDSKLIEYPMEEALDPKTIEQMEREFARTSFFTAENIIRSDERLRVSPCQSQPYRWVCMLVMTTRNGQSFLGTGSFTTMLGSNKPACIITAGHNLYQPKNGGFAVRVDIYPGRDRRRAPLGSFSVDAKALRVSDGWKYRQDPHEDYGAIFLSRQQSRNMPVSQYGFGYKILDDFDLHNRVVTIAGYPGDKPDGTMWIAGGRIKSVSQRGGKLLQYDTDTKGGQSGSPVWTWDRYNWMVVGIHGYGGERLNQARRISVDFVKNVHRWARDFS